MELLSCPGGGRFGNGMWVTERANRRNLDLTLVELGVPLRLPTAVPCGAGQYSSLLALPQNTR